MGLEALSRGAARAVFVDSDRDATRAIDRNLDKLGVRGAIVLQRDAVQVLAEEARRARRYDLVLVDPPYEMFNSLQNSLSRHLPPVLADDGIVVVETGARGPEPELESLALRTSRRYGAARITIFEHPQP
jgi:16S rRNA (guanine966-N2)-methyltransferase